MLNRENCDKTRISRLFQPSPGAKSGVSRNFSDFETRYVPVSLVPAEILKFAVVSADAGNLVLPPLFVERVKFIRPLQVIFLPVGCVHRDQCHNAQG